MQEAFRLFKMCLCIRDRFSLNLVPLYTTVSKHAVSVSNVSADTDFNISSFCCIFVSRLITSIETRNVRFFTFVFLVKGVISVILILLVAVHQQILSSTEQGFIGLLRGNRTSMF